MGGGSYSSSGGVGAAAAGGFKRADKRATITILVLGDGTFDRHGLLLRMVA
jgi:TPP-dependent indolepyruvate ferredoxin oxidoreductase alpha subunit